ncbi:MAG: hypothetical protein HOB88_11265 [Bacteroidetes bacterium]|mgnify:CR=1 FL=1|nr:hypothetical protein [Bacteroidota bacterium]
MVKNDDDRLNSEWLIPFILKYKWLLVLSGFIGALIVFIGCLITTPKYQASAIVYAAGVNASNPMQLAEGNSMLLLQLLESSYLKDSLTIRLNLAEHYQINTSKKDWKTAVGAEYDKNVSFKRTLYKSIRIRVLDKDPEFAAEMANAIVTISNEINTKIVKVNTVGYLNSVEEKYHEKKAEVDKLALEISSLKNINIDDARSNLEAKLLIKNSNINKIRIKITSIRKEHEVHGLSQQLDNVQSQFTRTESQLKHETAKFAVYEERLSPFDSLRIISEAQVAGLKEKKESLKTKLNKLNQSNDEYIRLNNELALEIQTRDQLVRRIETIQNTFEPGVQSIEMFKKQSHFENELAQLAAFKKEFEKAKSNYERAEPGSYLISQAVANYNKAYPNTLMFILIGFFLSVFLSFFALLIFKKA